MPQTPISSSPISGLGVLGYEDLEEEISSFSQGSSLSTITCSWSTTAFISSADSLAASRVILAAPGVKGLSRSGEGTKGVPGSGVSLRSSSNFESESAAFTTEWWRAVCKEQLLPVPIPDPFIYRPPLVSQSGLGDDRSHPHRSSWSLLHLG